MSALFEMMDKSFRIKLVIVSLLEHNLKQQISHFRSFNSTCNKSFGSFTLKSDYQTSGSWAFLSLQFR